MEIIFWESLNAVNGILPTIAFTFMSSSVPY